MAGSPVIADDPAKIDQVELFAAFCSTLILDSGKRFILEDFQRKIVKSILQDRVTESVIIIPKGNAKTTLLAAIALWHILTTHEAKCYIGAASAQQAGEMFLHACGFIHRDANRNGELSKLLRISVGYKRILTTTGASFLEVRAADANTQDGVGPTLALVDEYHRHPNDNLYGVFRDGLDKRNGQMVTISTAGDDEESALGKLRADLLQHTLTTDGRYLYAYNEEGDTVLHQWALKEDDDPNDLELVKLANPLSTITKKKLSRRRRSSSMTNGKWNRFTCNLWGQGDEAAITKPEWSAIYDADAEIPDNAEIFMGLDLGWKWDTTAMVPIWWDEESLRWIIGKVTILVPPRDGSSMKSSKVWDAMKWYAERYRVRLVMDPNAGGDLMVERLERPKNETVDGQTGLACVGDGNGILEVVEHIQAATPMAQAAMLTVELVREKGLSHPGDPEFTKQMLTAVADPIRGDDELYKFAKPRSKGSARRKRGEERTFQCKDAADALSMALRVAVTQEDTPVLKPWVA